MQTLKHTLGFLRIHLKATVATIVVLMIGWGVFAVTRPKQPVFITAPAVRGDLRQTVEAVGTVISDRDLQLQFPTMDIIAQVFVKEGDHVKAGTKLAILRSASLSAGVAGAFANVQSAQAQLNQLLEGSRPEDIAIAEAQVRNKQASLDAAVQTLKNAEDNIPTAQSQLAALKNEAAISLSGQVATAGSTVSQQLGTAKTALLTTQGVFNANDVQDAVVKGNPSGYDTFQSNLAATISSITSLESGLRITDDRTALKNLDVARLYVGSTADIVNRGEDILSALPLTGYFTNTSRETNKTTLAIQKTAVQSALLSIDAATKALRDASAGEETRIAAQESQIVVLQGTRDRAKADIATYRTSLQIDEATLALKKAPTRQTDIDAARARVRQAQADLARATAQYNDAILTAPVEGIVTKVNVKAGEMRPSTEPSVTMLGNSPYRIEMFVSEIDIPKVRLAQTGSVKLDAFPDKRFALRVNEIDSAATDRDGVSKYRVKLDFVYPHDELKIGMTGDADITTGFRADIVSVPLRAVIGKDDGTKFVRILKADGKSFDEATVTTGMEGEGGNVEVTGVGLGATVIVLIKN